MNKLTHWKKLRDTNYLGSWDLATGKELSNGNPEYKSIVLKIRKVVEEEVMNLTTNKKDRATVCYFEHSKPMILNVTNCKNIEKALGSKFIEKWVGKEIEIEVQQIKAFGDILDALRIKKRPPVEKQKYYCSICNCEISENIKIRSEKATGTAMCIDCGRKEVTNGEGLVQ